MRLAYVVDFRNILKCQVSTGVLFLFLGCKEVGALVFRDRGVEFHFVRKFRSADTDVAFLTLVCLRFNKTNVSDTVKQYVRYIASNVDHLPRVTGVYYCDNQLVDGDTQDFVRIVVGDQVYKHVGEVLPDGVYLIDEYLPSYQHIFGPGIIRAIMWFLEKAAVSAIKCDNLNEAHYVNYSTEPPMGFRYDIEFDMEKFLEENPDCRNNTNESPLHEDSPIEIFSERRVGEHWMCKDLRYRPIECVFTSMKTCPQVSFIRTRIGSKPLIYANCTESYPLGNNDLVARIHGEKATYVNGILRSPVNPGEIPGFTAPTLYARTIELEIYCPVQITLDHIVIGRWITQNGFTIDESTRPAFSDGTKYLILMYSKGNFVTRVVFKTIKGSNTGEVIDLPCGVIVITAVVPIELDGTFQRDLKHLLHTIYNDKLLMSIRVKPFGTVVRRESVSVRSENEENGFSRKIKETGPQGDARPLMMYMRDFAAAVDFVRRWHGCVTEVEVQRKIHHMCPVVDGRIANFGQCDCDTRPETRLFIPLRRAECIVALIKNGSNIPIVRAPGASEIVEKRKKPSAIQLETLGVIVCSRDPQSVSVYPHPDPVSFFDACSMALGDPVEERIAQLTNEQIMSIVKQELWDHSIEEIRATLVDSPAYSLHYRLVEVLYGVNVIAFGEDNVPVIPRHCEYHIRMPNYDAPTIYMVENVYADTSRYRLLRCCSGVLMVGSVEMRISDPRAAQNGTCATFKFEKANTNLEEIIRLMYPRRVVELPVCNPTSQYIGDDGHATHVELADGSLCELTPHTMPYPGVPIANNVASKCLSADMFFAYRTACTFSSIALWLFAKLGETPQKFATRFMDADDLTPPPPIYTGFPTDSTLPIEFAHSVWPTRFLSDGRIAIDRNGIIARSLWANITLMNPEKHTPLAIEGIHPWQYGGCENVFDEVEAYSVWVLKEESKRSLTSYSSMPIVFSSDKSNGRFVYYSLVLDKRQFYIMNGVSNGLNAEQQLRQRFGIQRDRAMSQIVAVTSLNASHGVGTLIRYGDGIKMGVVFKVVCLI